MLTNILNTIKNYNEEIYKHTYNYIYEYIHKKDLEQLLNCKTEYTILIKSFNCGILPLVIFLYEHKNVSFNNNLLVNFNYGIVSDSIDGSTVTTTIRTSNNKFIVDSNHKVSSMEPIDMTAVAQTESSNTTLNIEIIDKYKLDKHYHNYKAICYNYLQYLKRYSKLVTYNKNFYYKLNYRVNTDEYIIQWLQQI